MTSEYFDPHAIAGLLKSFFRELPVHIFTNELNPDFIRANDIEDHSRKVKELCRLVQSLPVANYSALRFLSAHLVKIVQKESINKMSVRNMGIVFSPTLAIPASKWSARSVHWHVASSGFPLTTFHPSVSTLRIVLERVRPHLPRGRR